MTNLVFIYFQNLFDSAVVLSFLKFFFSATSLC